MNKTINLEKYIAVFLNSQTVIRGRVFASLQHERHCIVCSSKNVYVCATIQMATLHWDAWTSTSIFHHWDVTVQEEKGLWSCAPASSNSNISHSSINNGLRKSNVGEGRGSKGEKGRRQSDRHR